MARRRASRRWLAVVPPIAAKAWSGNAGDALRPQVVQGRPALVVAWVRLLEPWRFDGRHCHAETVHDTCSRRGATWRSGDAADCKSAHPGSIPGVASQGARS